MRALKILIVENHQDTLVFMERYLEFKGHTVRCAPDFASAVTDLENHSADVLISDIGLPDGSGWELMTRATAINPDLYGIAMSGFGMKSDHERSLAAGYRHHLLKPFLPTELDELLERAAAEFRDETSGG